MGFLSNLFKTNVPKRQLRLQLVELKYTTKKVKELYSGQIVSIICDEEKDRYGLETYPDNQTVGYLSPNDYQYGEKYKYALLKDISEEGITACIICDNNIYLQNFHITTTQNIQNGEVLEIEKINNEYKLKYNSKIIGDVTDNRINENIVNNLLYVSFSNGFAQAVIYKNEK